ncbi:hypothetical protein MXD63_39840, partial [Frankia sp. Cpl3]|nr:hypothetical protein [Frankia sp. Cpl3]
MIHDFSSSAYYGMRFGERQENLFSDVRVRVDGKLGTVSGRAVEKIEAIYERLESGDPEAISHAMTSCRRLVDDFIDALFPALDESRDIDGHSLKLGQQNRLNRLTAYVAQKIDSDGRKNRIRREMSDVYERINK